MWSILLDQLIEYYRTNLAHSYRTRCSNICRTTDRLFVGSPGCVFVGCLGWVSVRPNDRPLPVVEISRTNYLSIIRIFQSSISAVASFKRRCTIKVCWKGIPYLNTELLQALPVLSRPLRLPRRPPPTARAANPSTLIFVNRANGLAETVSPAYTATRIRCLLLHRSFFYRLWYTVSNCLLCDSKGEKNAAVFMWRVFAHSRPGACKLGAGSGISTYARSTCLASSRVGR